MAHLEHLDVCDAEIKIGGVAKDEAPTEEQTDGEDGANKYRLSHMNILDAVKQVGRPLEHSGADSLPR